MYKEVGIQDFWLGAFIGYGFEEVGFVLLACESNKCYGKNGTMHVDMGYNLS